MKKVILIFILLVVSIFSSLTFAQSSDSSILSVSLVNQDPDPAIAGDIVELRISFENIGGVAVEDLIVEMVLEYPFTILPGEDKFTKVGTISSYQYDENMKIVKFKLRVDRDAIAGEYELKIKYYPEGETTTTQKSLNIEVKNKESAEVIHIDKSTLIPGEESSLKFTITNVGNAPLRDMTFYWENEDNIILPVGSDNTKYVKYVDIGESVELQYKVIADTNADPGLYKLNLHLTYDNPLTGVDKEISTIAGIYVGGTTDFDIAFSETSAGETSFSVANIGSNPAFSVSVIIPVQNGWKVSGSSSAIIGNLNKGDYTVASFKLQSRRTTKVSKEGLSRDELIKQRETAQTQETIKIQIAYTDTMGQRDIVEKEVKIDSTSMTTESTSAQFGGRNMHQQSFFSKNKGYMITLAIIVLGLILYSMYKKKKLTNPHFKLKDLFKNKR